MNRYDSIVVGGGPAGSACAARLREAGQRVAVLDREAFPRTKLCAGWITPQVVADLGFDIAEYPHRFNTFENLVVHLRGLSFTVSGPQHSIRRFEFDAWLLERSGAEVHRHNVRDVRRENDAYVIDGRFECTHLVGAGGTRCPVYRELFRDANPRAADLQIATLEQEFEYAWTDPRCHLWFFDDGLPGYAWYVPKARGWLNCGLGGVARSLKDRGHDLRSHWRRFTGRLADDGLVRGIEFDPRGYSYYLRGAVDTVRIDGAYIVGDAAGLASIDLGEGIGPAVRSGQRAARSILTGSEYSLADLDDMSLGPAWLRWLVRRFVARGSRAAATAATTRPRAA